MEEVLRELSDTELDMVSGGAAAAAATSSGGSAVAVANQGTGFIFGLVTRPVNIIAVEVQTPNGPAAGAGAGF
jgi:hypothetical protein